jgi:hypothetical protein
MATSFVHDVSKGLNSFLAGNWAWIDAANGFRSGYGTANSYSSLSKHNFEIQRRSVSNKTFFGFGQSLIQSSWKISRTALKALRLAPSFPLLASRTATIKYSAACWIGMNFFALLQHAFSGPDSEIKETSFGLIWEKTPEALLVTNIALTALELRVNSAKALFSLASLGFTYFEVKKAPNNRNFIWNWVCPIAARGIVFYYGNNWQRAMVGIDIVTSAAKLAHDLRK